MSRSDGAEITKEFRTRREQLVPYPSVFAHTQLPTMNWRAPSFAVLNRRSVPSSYVYDSDERCVV